MESVHKHGMDLLRIYLISVVETHVNHTHIFHMFFAGFDKWYSL